MNGRLKYPYWVCHVAHFVHDTDRHKELPLNDRLNCILYNLTSDHYKDLIFEQKKNLTCTTIKSRIIDPVCSPYWTWWIQTHYIGSFSIINQCVQCTTSTMQLNGAFSILQKVWGIMLDILSSQSNYDLWDKPLTVNIFLLCWEKYFPKSNWDPYQDRSLPNVF